MTQELRHQTLTSTLLAEPRRNRVMVAKMAAYAVIGAVYGVDRRACSATRSPSRCCRSRTTPTSRGPRCGRSPAAPILGCALFAVLGVALGTLIRNQIAAILGVLVWVLIIEALLVSFLPSVGKWLPRRGAQRHPAGDRSEQHGVPPGVGRRARAHRLDGAVRGRGGRHHPAPRRDLITALIRCRGASRPAAPAVRLSERSRRRLEQVVPVHRRAITVRSEGSSMSTSDQSDRAAASLLSARTSGSSTRSTSSTSTDPKSVDPAWWDFFADYVPTEHAGADLVAASAAVRAAHTGRGRGRRGRPRRRDRHPRRPAAAAAEAGSPPAPATAAARRRPRCRAGDARRGREASSRRCCAGPGGPRRHQHGGEPRRPDRDERARRPGEAADRQPHRHQQPPRPRPRRQGVASPTSSAAPSSQARQDDARDEPRLRRGRRQARRGQARARQPRPRHRPGQARRHPPAARARTSRTPRRWTSRQFWPAYEDIVRKARDGKLTVDDFAGHDDHA